MTRSLSVIIPVYMEAGNIRQAVNGAINAVDGAGISEYELIIVTCLRPDGTHDGTPLIAEELAAKNPRIRVIHNPYVNLGYKFFQGVRAAQCEYVTWIPGDNENKPESITKTLRRIGEADLIIPYPVNMRIRPLTRRIVSKTYTALINILFGLRLRYFNGLSVYRVKLIRQLPRWTESFAFSAEILVTLIKSGATYIEVPIILGPRSGGKSSALKFKNIINVIRAILTFFWRTHFKRAH